MDSDPCSDFAQHELLPAIGLMLTELSDQHNDVPLSADDLTVFHASGPSLITISEYVLRLHRHIECSPECFVVAVIFLDRLLAASPSVHLGRFTAHRLIVTAVVLAIKAVDDEYYRNSYYAYIGGIPAAELNRMEIVFLASMQYALYVSAEEFAAYRDRLRWYLVDHALTGESMSSATQSPLTASAGRCWPAGTPTATPTDPSPHSVLAEGDNANGSCGNSAGGRAFPVRSFRVSVDALDADALDCDDPHDADGALPHDARGDGAARAHALHRGGRAAGGYTGAKVSASCGLDGAGLGVATGFLDGDALAALAADAGVGVAAGGSAALLPFETDVGDLGDLDDRDSGMDMHSDTHSRTSALSVSPLYALMI